MDKITFINETSELAEKFAFLFERFTEDRPQYFGKTDAQEPICIGSISASIQGGELATLEVSVGSSDSSRKIVLRKYPSSDDEWSIEDK
jgi:hypothetical protein